MTQEQVIIMMKSSKSAQEWDDNCNKVKAAHNGEYPKYWFTTIIQSGLLHKLTATWAIPQGDTP